MVGLLCDSFICRLCGDDNPNGINLFDKNSKLDSIVNKYLPLKVKDDGASPKTICPTCRIHLQDTAFFFDLIIKGQIKIRQLRIEELSRLAGVEGGKCSNIIINSKDYNCKSGNNGLISFKELYYSDEIEFFPVKSDNKTSIEYPNIDNKNETIDPLRTDIITNFLNEPSEAKDGAVVIEGPKKRGRGRPRKDRPSSPVKVEEAIPRNTRAKKFPLRFTNLVQGKELDKLFKEVGVTNEEIKDHKTDEPKEERGDKIIGFVKTFCGNIIGTVKIILGTKVQTKLECDLCNKTFFSMSIFLSHKMKGICGVYSCTKCASQFEKGEELQEHLKNCSATKESWRCPICGTIHGSVFELEMHTLKEHSPEKCPFCSHTFQLRRSLESHISRKHRTKKMLYVCQHCDKMFSNFFTARYHEAAKHPTHLFHCVQCNKKFKVRQTLAKHCLTHTSDRSFFCNTCSKSYKSRSSLKSHVVSHATKQQKFICDLCKSSFSNKSSLNVHMKIHTGEKPHTCVYCKKSFIQKGNYIEHLRVHSGERPFKCDLCKSSFKTSSQLRAHKMLHTGERPFVCEFCNKSFLHKESWKTHLRRHQGIKPYTCALCSKTFTELWALKKHLRTHTGERPYSCEVCGKTFSNSSNYVKHMKKVHEEGAPKQDSVMYLDLNQLTNQELNDLRLNILDTTGGGCEEGDTVCVAITSSQSEVQVAPQPEIQEIKKVNLIEDESRKIVTDGQGNPLTVTLCDGSELQVTTMDGESLQVLTSDGISIPVKLTSDIDVNPLDQLATFDPSLNVDVSGSLTELTQLGEDYNVQFVTDDGQDIRLLTSPFNVSSLKWDLPS